jgi:hypothetical protein
LPLLLAPVFECADESEEAAFVNALKNPAAVCLVVDDRNPPFSLSIIKADQLL